MTKQRAIEKRCRKADRTRIGGLTVERLNVKIHPQINTGVFGAANFLDSCGRAAAAMFVRVL